MCMSQKVFEIFQTIFSLLFFFPLPLPPSLLSSLPPFLPPFLSLSLPLSLSPFSLLFLQINTNTT